MFKINTPNRKHGITKLTWGSYKYMAAMMLSAPGSSKSFIIEMGRKVIREMHILSSDEYDSFLRSPIEALNNFSWDKVMTEFSKALPTLILMQQTTRRSVEHWTRALTTLG